MESLWEHFAVAILFLLAGKMRLSHEQPAVAETRFGQRHPLWRSVRDRYVSKNPACAVCGKASNLSVHHKLPVSLYPDRELDEENLVTLCQNNSFNCHFVVGHLMNWNSYNPDVDADISYWRRRLRGRLEKKSLLQFFRW